MVMPASVAWNSLRREPFGVVDLIFSFVSSSKLARLFISFTVINLFIYSNHKATGHREIER
jgi:hypothetical protein